MKVEFDLKYGKNKIEIPVDKRVIETHPKETKNIYGSKVTIYNDIASDGVNPRTFNSFVIDKCMIQGGFVEKSDGTIQNIVNAITVITKDVEHYKSPIEYALLPVDEKKKYFTVQVDDFIVFSEVDDVVNSGREFQDLQNKYKNNGMSVTTANAFIYGTDVDNITITNA